MLSPPILIGTPCSAASVTKTRIHYNFVNSLILFLHRSMPLSFIVQNRPRNETMDLNNFKTIYYVKDSARDSQQFFTNKILLSLLVDAV
jgi:hypothetical protein